MDYLFDNWDKVKERLQGEHLFIFLDFDGTLAPFTDKPARALLSEETRKLLKDLSESPGNKLAIISGRALKDIKTKIGLKNIIYAGNHGLEIEGPKIKFKSSLPSGYKFIMSRIKDDLARNISLFPGAFLEDKGISLSLHYRAVGKKQIPRIKALFNETLQSYTARGSVKTKAEAMVLEVMPPVDWDKAKTVLWLLAIRNCRIEQGNFFPIYIGDDISDEGVFKALKNKGMTVHVGRRKNSYARYYVKNTDETAVFLKRLP